MTESERKIKKRVQLVVASAMALFFCLLVTLAVQLSVRANQRVMEKRLTADHRALLEKIALAEGNIEDMADADRYRDEWLLMNGFGQPGAKIIEIVG